MRLIAKGVVMPHPILGRRRRRNDRSFFSSNDVMSEASSLEVLMYYSSSSTGECRLGSRYKFAEWRFADMECGGTIKLRRTWVSELRYLWKPVNGGLLRWASRYYDMMWHHFSCMPCTLWHTYLPQDMCRKETKNTHLCQGRLTDYHCVKRSWTSRLVAQDLT